MRRFEQAAAGLPHVTVRVTAADYGPHAKIPAAFAEYVIAQLLPICGRRPERAPV